MGVVSLACNHPTLLHQLQLTLLRARLLGLLLTLPLSLLPLLLLLLQAPADVAAAVPGAATAVRSADRRSVAVSWQPAKPIPFTAQEPIAAYQ
jgi:hypothetical protein